MAKDPAMLWYWSDWHSGTGLMSRFLKGCYMDLLHAQFNNGHLSLEEIKTCLGSDFGTSWPTVQKKFKQDGNGLFFNERLELEQNKRKAFSESRRQNVLKKEKKPTYDDTYVEHMNTHMENENRNENNNQLWTEAKKAFFNDFIWYEDFCRKKSVSPAEMKRQMQEFINDLDLTGDIKELKELKSHFLHSFNKGKYKKVEVTDKEQSALTGIYDTLRKAQQANQ